MNKLADEVIGQGSGLSRLRSNDVAEADDRPLGSVGQELRRVRESRGLDLSQISNVLKIRKNHLTALEEDRIDKLPGRTYAVGFVRSYAQYLGLDADKLSDRFKSEILGRADEPHLIQHLDTGPERSLPHGWIVIALVVLAGAAYGVYRLAMPSDSEVPAVAPVPISLSAPSSASKPHLAPPAANPNPQPGPAETGTTPAPAPETTLPTTSTVPAALPQLPPGQAYGQRNADARIVLRMHEVAFVSVKGPGGIIYLSRVLQPGDSYKVPNHAGMVLSTANAAAVELDLDGAMAGMAADTPGEVKDMVLDPQTVASRHNAAAPH